METILVEQSSQWQGPEKRQSPYFKGISSSANGGEPIPADTLQRATDRTVPWRRLLVAGDLENLERCRMCDAEPRTCLSRHTLEELRGVEVLPAEAVDVGLVRSQGLDSAFERLRDVRGVARLR